MTPNPMRLQRSRKKGSRLTSPNGLPVVCVSRGTKYGNRHKVGWCEICQKNHDRGEATAMFRKELEDDIAAGRVTRDDLNELKNKNLACWCSLPENETQPDLCHARVWIEFSNSDESKS